MNILSIFGIITKEPAIIEKSISKNIDTKDFLTTADGVADLTSLNVSRYTNELVNLAKTNNVRININKLDDNAVILSLNGKKNSSAKPYVIANFYKGNDTLLPLIDKITKTFDEAYSNFIKINSGK